MLLSSEAHVGSSMFFVIPRVASSIISAVLVVLASLWSRAPVVCEVRCPGREADSYILEILETQLQRCGPEHLSAQPPSCTGLSAAAAVGGTLLVFIAGAACGALLALTWVARSTAPRRAAGPASPAKVAPVSASTPSSLRLRSSVG